MKEVVLTSKRFPVKRERRPVRYNSSKVTLCTWTRFQSGGLIPYPLKCVLHVPSSGSFQSLIFYSSTVLLSAPNRCRRTDDDAPKTSIYSDIFIRTAEDVKADHGERVLDYAQ